jgi:hypothetical protein
MRVKHPANAALADTVVEKLSLDKKVSPDYLGNVWEGIATCPKRLHGSPKISDKTLTGGNLRVRIGKLSLSLSPQEQDPPDPFILQCAEASVGNKRRRPYRTEASEYQEHDYALTKADQFAD